MPHHHDCSPIAPDYLRTGDLIKMLPVARNTLHAMVKRGELPRPDMIIGNQRLWHKSTIMPAVERILKNEVA